MENNKIEKLEEILLNDFGSYDEYTVEKICDLFGVVRQSEQLVYECKVCGKPFGDNLSLYEHYNEEHN